MTTVNWAKFFFISVLLASHCHPRELVTLSASLLDKNTHNLTFQSFFSRCYDVPTVLHSKPIPFHEITNKMNMRHAACVTFQKRTGKGSRVRKRRKIHTENCSEFSNSLLSLFFLLSISSPVDAVVLAVCCLLATSAQWSLFPPTQRQREGNSLLMFVSFMLRMNEKD